MLRGILLHNRIVERFQCCVGGRLGHPASGCPHSPPLHTTMFPCIALVMPFSRDTLTELNMTLVRLSVAKSLRDPLVSQLLGEWVASSPLARAPWSEPREVGYPSLIRTKQVEALKQYASHLFPAPDLIGLLMDLNVPKVGIRHHKPPTSPPTKTDTPKGAKKKDDRPEDPIIGTVVHVPYPKGVERVTVRGIHGRKYGAVWVEYRGGTTLYEVNRSLLFPTPEGAERTGKRPGRRAQRRPDPPPPQTKRLTPRTQTLPPNPLTQLTPRTPLTPHPDPRRCGTPLRGPTRYEGPDRDPRGHNGHGQET